MTTITPPIASIVNRLQEAGLEYWVGGLGVITPHSTHKIKELFKTFNVQLSWDITINDTYLKDSTIIRPNVDYGKCASTPVSWGSPTADANSVLMNNLYGLDLREYDHMMCAVAFTHYYCQTYYDEYLMRVVRFRLRELNKELFEAVSVVYWLTKGQPRTFSLRLDDDLEVMYGKIFV